MTENNKLKNITFSNIYSSQNVEKTNIFGLHNDDHIVNHCSL